MERGFLFPFLLVLKKTGQPIETDGGFFYTGGGRQTGKKAKSDDSARENGEKSPKTGGTLQNIGKHPSRSPNGGSLELQAKPDGTPYLFYDLLTYGP